MSLYFPSDIKKPYQVGFNHFYNGLSTLKKGEISGVFELALGFFECVPIANYLFLKVERMVSLGNAEKNHGRKA